MFNLIHNNMANHIFQNGTLTVTVFVSPTYKNGVKVYHGKSYVKTVKGVHWIDVQEELKNAIQEYLVRCKFKEAERTFSWKYETY